MSGVFLEELGLPTPDHHLGVGSGSHAEQTAGVMTAYEKTCMADRPDWIIVVGDVNSTAACALVGAKMGIRVVHLEAGLRSRDRTMPEEINRLVTDAIADVLWTPSEDADQNLLNEGVSPDRIDRVGNIMIDSLEMLRPVIDAAGTREELKLGSRPYAVVTLHRPSNVDSAERLMPIVDALVAVSESMDIVFAAHPRTVKNLDRFGLNAALFAAPGVRMMEPMPYTKFMNLVTGATCIITDSGGLQEETTYLGIPCLTLRENTERPVTITMGTNRLVDAPGLGDQLEIVIAGKWPKGRCPSLWDGNTAARAVACLQRRSR